MTPTKPIIHIVDDDESFRKAVMRLLRAAGYETRSYASAAGFLAASPGAGPGCALLDVQMPGLGGLDLQQALATMENPLPAIFLTGHGDIPITVHAMKAGAVDFLTKPVPRAALIDAVQRALVRDTADRAARAQQRELRSRYETLTPREREVFALVVSGKPNKQIAGDLGTTERTIKAHRAQVMQKMRVPSLAELVHLAEVLGFVGDGQKPPAVHPPPNLYQRSIPPSR